MPSSGGRKKKTTTDDPTAVTSDSGITSGDTSGGSDTSDTSSTSEIVPVVTLVTLNKHTASVIQGGTLDLTATVRGENNPSLDVTWTASNSYATVSNGHVSISNNAPANQKVTVTATSVVTPTVSDSCEITILQTDGSYTILVYMCGADLESSYASQNQGLASSDLLEMLGTPNKPSNVNIVIETGGASKWSSNPGVDKNYLQRYHIANNQLVLDKNETKANMGLANTLKSFITWGCQTYPADKTGLIFWNHGGAVTGACFDENYSNDGLLASEMAEAYQGAFNTLGVDKLEWVGYDCCIMAYADLAAINSQYFNYMVSSQELESGYGWDYDAWLPSLYSNTSISTPTLLSTICDTFVSENGGDSSNNDQCLSVLDLSKMASFTTAFDTTFAGSLTSSNWSNISSTYSSVLKFADLSDYHSGTYGYGMADMKAFLTKAQSSYSFNTGAALTALNQVTIHSAYGGYYGSTKPCGLNIFVPADDYYAQVSEDDYGENDTLFTNWRNFVIANGTFAGGGWGW